MAVGAANKSDGAGRRAEPAGWRRCRRGVSTRDGQVGGPMARGPASGGAERSSGEGAARRGRSGGGRGGAMDRVSSSMKQVSNPLPKVLSRRAGGGGLEAERESFERAQVRGGAAGRGRAGPVRRVMPPGGECRPRGRGRQGAVGTAR